MLARSDGVGGRNDRVRDVLVEDAQLGVRARRGLLDAGECLDVAALEARAGDREVLDGALRLGAATMGTDEEEDGPACLPELPDKPNPVTQSEMDAGSVELF